MSYLQKRYKKRASVVEQALGAILGAEDAATTTAPTSDTLKDALSGDTVKAVSGIALTFHGYRRTDSLFWALLYGLAGRSLPLVAVPVALAQGYGKRKECR